MITIMDELEAPSTDSGSWKSEWSPAIGVHELNSMPTNDFVQNLRSPGPVSELRPAAFQSDQQQKTFRLDEPLRPDDQFAVKYRFRVSRPGVCPARWSS